MPPNALTKAQKSIQKFAEDIISSLPKVNNKTSKRKAFTPEQVLQHPDFVYPCPNPTIVHSDTAVDISKLDPEAFDLIGSKIILFGPDIFWHGLVRITCPLCGENAAPHGWCKTLRRVKGLSHTFFLVGRRYKCVDCKGGCSQLQLVAWQRACLQLASYPQALLYEAVGSVSQLNSSAIPPGFRTLGRAWLSTAYPAAGSAAWQACS
jgi:hypothetical protein